ncbi:MAG: hypothetical protein J2P46_21325, partial [Zavarzinella sp.]|nr:hypothetical protein [Zavarzinella sp.]
MSRKAAWRAAAALGVVVIAAIGVAAWLYPRKAPAGLAVNPGDHIVIVGNGLAERMQYFGHFEALLHGRFPDHELVVRDLGYAGDEVTVPPTRAVGFFDHGHKLEDHKPDLVIACYGFNESFAGPAGLRGFEDSLDRFVTETTAQAGNGRAPPRLARVSPIAHADPARPGPPD